MISSVAGCIYGFVRLGCDNYKYRYVHLHSHSNCSDVYMIANRTLEFSMQVSVLLHMMRYFTEYIVNLKKKLVRKYIVGCIITYFIYFSFFIGGLYIQVDISYTDFHVDERRYFHHNRDGLRNNKYTHFVSVYNEL